MKTESAILSGVNADPTRTLAIVSRRQNQVGGDIKAGSEKGFRRGRDHQLADGGVRKDLSICDACFPALPPLLPFTHESAGLILVRWRVDGLNHVVNERAYLHL